MPHRTLAELAELCGATLEGDGTRTVSGPSDLASAGSDQISFLANARYGMQMDTTRAAAVLLGTDVKVRREDLILLRVEDPNSAFSKIVNLFAETDIVPGPGVHPSAVVDPTAELGADVSIGPLCSVGAGARLGDGVILHAGVSIGAEATVGARTVLFSNAVLYSRVSVGCDCILHAGCVVGSDGFGFKPTQAGWDKVPQCGTVVLEDEVELGANTTIDRARFGATTLRRGVKLDNLVHIAHNVTVGEASLLCAQVGTSGSTLIGRRVVVAGQVGFEGHIFIGDGAQIGGQAGVTKSIAPGEKVNGSPARRIRQHLGDLAQVRKIPDLRERVKELEERLAALEGAPSSLAAEGASE